jgi:hypothetical protein
VPIISATGGITNRWFLTQAGLGIKQDPISKITTSKGLQVAEVQGPEFDPPSDTGYKNQAKKQRNKEKKRTENKPGLWSSYTGAKDNSPGQPEAKHNTLSKKKKKKKKKNIYK